LTAGGKERKSSLKNAATLVLKASFLEHIKQNTEKNEEKKEKIEISTETTSTVWKLIPCVVI